MLTSFCDRVALLLVDALHIVADGLHEVLASHHLSFSGFCRVKHMRQVPLSADSRYHLNVIIWPVCWRPRTPCTGSSACRASICWRPSPTLLALVPPLSVRALASVTGRPLSPMPSPLLALGTLCRTCHAQISSRWLHRAGCRLHSCTAMHQ